MNYAIILAGGTGSRFWPLSRTMEPKQFLNLCSGRPMIEDTISRIRDLIKQDDIYIATNKIYLKNIKNCLKQLSIPMRNIFFEPERRNTLAPIGVLSKKIYDKDKDSVILVMPADHHIKNDRKFLNTLEKAIGVAKKGHIVTIGITPDSPETGYGYIKVKSKHKGFYSIERFIEKPELVKARRFVKDKRFYWNGGIFIFRADVMLEEIKRYALADHMIINKIKDKTSLNKFWSRFTSISIDYAVMEKTGKTALIPADFGWMDLGSWKAIEYFAKKDKCGNIFKGNCVDIGSKNTLAWSDNRLLATLGLNNIVIVDTKDALLVCSKDKTQDVRKIVQKLQQNKFKEQI